MRTYSDKTAALWKLPDNCCFVIADNEGKIVLCVCGGGVHVCVCVCVCVCMCVCVCV